MALRRRDFLGAVAGGGFLSTLPIGRLAAQTTETWAQIASDAKKEGMLQIYSVISTAPVVAVSKAFEKKTGIRTEFLAVAKPNELREKVRVEQTSGRYVADVMITTVSQTTVISAEDKTIAPLPHVPNASRLRERFENCSAHTAYGNNIERHDGQY